MIRINVDSLIEFTDLSWAPPESIIRKIYIRSVDLKLSEAQDKADEGHIIGHQDKLPRPAMAKDMCNFYVMPARHQAYSTFWLYASFLIGAGNAFVWLYM